MREWAEESLDIVVSLGRLCDSATVAPEFAARREPLLTSLSAQIEKGRWFFPNVLDAQVGEWKEAAYRGYRQPILDHLVEAFDAAAEVEPEHASEACATLTRCQRTFVSAVQIRLDPKRRDVEYQTLVDRYDDLDRYLGTYSALGAE